MKRLTGILTLLIIITLFFVSCQKEVDWGISDKVSVGSLNCAGSTVSGNYKQDSVLNSGHFVNINVDIDSAGSYSIFTDTVNGYFFRAIGTFATTGPQAVKLVGTGKPVAAGTNTFTVKYNGSICQFSVTVAASGSGGGGGGNTGTSVYSIDCSSAALSGTYEASTPMTLSNTVVLNVTVTTAGSWNLTSGTANGISFSGSGNFATTGSQTITLTATGTPAASGAFNIPVNSGSSNCSFQVTFTAGAAVDWKFTEGSVTYQGTITSAQLQSVATVSAFSYSGSNANNDGLVFALADLSGGINANETYSSSNASGNSGGFVFSAASGEMYTADLTTTGVTLTFKVTSHNTSTKSIQGTFSGTVRNSANAAKTISNGTFKGTYQ